MKQQTILSPLDIKRYNSIFWRIIIGFFAFIVLIIGSTWLGLFGKLPSFRDLENPKSNQASVIYTQDKTELGNYFAQNRSNVQYQDINPILFNTLIATEDTRFNDHSGIDFRRTFTILFYNLIGKKQGASTITQQLALNLFSKEGRQKSFIKRLPQKLKELIVAVRLERNYTKEEIITMYLNIVDFGNNSFGIKAATKTYFNTSPKNITPSQAALLVGILKGTSMYSPTRNPQRALGRRNLILTKLADAGYIPQTEAEELKKEDLGLKFNS